MISHVPPASVGAVWAALSPMIEKGLSHGQGDETSPEQMRAAIERGDMQMWVVHEGEDIKAGIVLSVTDAAVRKLWVEMLVGRDMGEWIDELERLVCDFRDLIGAGCVEASCRPGLAKYLARRKWKRKAIIMSLET
jgi:hypothetical protein